METGKKVLDKGLQDFIGHVRESNLAHPKDFQKIFVEGLTTGKITDEELATKFKLKVGDVVNWKSGKAAPPVEHRHIILKYLLECAINNSKYAN